jgi:hypothetical protein
MSYDITHSTQEYSIANTQQSYTVTETEVDPFDGMLFWLTTVSGSQLLDITGKARHFTITGKDFTGSYVPFKTAATISAPAGDATLIAADVNSFLYTDGTPNEIPLVKFFQNVDYEDKLFCKIVSRTTNADSTENVAPHLENIVLYENVLTGAALSQANDNYGVPTKETSNVQWVAKDGDDDTGDGSEGSPYLTIQAAHNAASNNDTIYVKTGTYTEGTYLSLLKPLTIKGIGDVVLRSTGAAYTARYANIGAITLNFERVTFDCQELTNRCFTDNPGLDGYEVNFTKCKFYNYSIDAVSISATSSTSNYTDCVFISSRLAEASGRATITTTGKTNNPVSTVTGCFIADNSYDGINVNVLQHHYNKQLYSGSNYFVSGFYSTGADVDYKYNTFISTNSHNQVMDKRAVYVVGATSVDIGYNYINIDSIYSFIAIDVFGEAGTITTSCDIYNNYIIDYAHWTHVLSVGTEEPDAGDNQVQNIVIENNAIFCHRYFDSSQEIITHSLYVGFQKDAIIRYNYVNGGGINIIYKGSTGTDSTGTAAIYGNVTIDAYENGIMIKAIEGVLVYNNTIWNENAIRSATNQHSLYLLPNLGGDDPENTVVKNNIIVDVSTNATTHLIFLAASLTGADVLTFDYNVMYSANGAYGWRTDMRDATFAQWQSLGYDANSVELTSVQAAALFTDEDNEDFSLASGSEAIEAGETLAATYDDGLDETTDYGDTSTIPVIVTKQQTAPWDAGAYIS